MRLLIALAILLSLMAGCRRASAPPTAPPTTPTSVTESPDKVTPPAPVVKPKVVTAIAGRKPLRFDRSLRAIDKSDPRVLEEPVEQVSALVQQQLQSLRNLLMAGSRDERAYSEIAGDAFRCGKLRPDLSPVRAPAGVRIERGAAADTWSPADEQRGAAGLINALGKLTQPLAKAKALHAQFSLLAASDVKREATTTVHAQFSGQTPQGAIQYNARWKCQWDISRRPIKLISIAVEDHEEVTIDTQQARWFSDCTAAVLGKSSAWAEQLAWGVDDWRARREKPIAPAAMGLQGLAIGDVNGDGRDDLYLCYGVGLPNRLLVQNADGSATEISAAAGVDWLDACASALLVDLDNDGDQDLLVASERELLVHLNDGQAKFELKQEIPLAAQPLSLAAADYDNDGRLDIFVATFAPPEEMADSLLGHPSSLLGAVGAGASVLLHNETDGTLRDATSDAGIASHNLPYALASSWQDVDGDGDQDLLVTHAFGTHALFRNEEFGRFQEASHELGLPEVGNTISSTWGDFTGDGQSDLYLGGTRDAAGTRVLHGKAPPGIADAHWQALRKAFHGGMLISAGDIEKFSDATTAARAELPRTTWGLRAADINNDGQLDLLAGGGMISGVSDLDLSSFFWRRIAQPSPPAGTDSALGATRAAYDKGWQTLSHFIAQGDSWNAGERGICLLNLDQATFADASSASGFDFAADTRAIATTDWDDDGDLDVWLTNRTAPSVRFVKNNSGGRSVAVQLQGVTCNRDAIGARVSLTLKPSGRRLVRVLQAGDGFLSQSTKWLHFGMPKGEEVAALVVAWPGGADEEFSSVKAGERYRLVQGSGKPESIARRGQLNLAPTADPLPQPPAAANLYLISRLPLPLLKYRNFDEKGIELGGQRESKTLVYLWSSEFAPSVSNLELLARKSFDLRLGNVEVVALSVDDVPLGKLFSPAAQATIRKLNFPYAAGMADARLIDQLEAVQRTLLGLEQPLVVPSALLIDEHGRVAALYRGPINTARIADDAKALTGDMQASRARASSLPGKWRGEPSAINPQALAETLYAGAFDDATLDYVNMLIAVGHSRSAGYEQLLPDRLYYLLGTLLEARGRDDEAAEAYRVVLQVDEKHQPARRRLASIAGRLGHYEEAADTLRALVRSNPDDVTLRHEWAVRLADAGDILQSIAQHREVLARQPDAVATANNLAWLLATNPDPEIRQSEEALLLARKVCEETNYERPEMLDTLAAAYASAGRIDGARTTSLRALDLARKQKQPRESIEVIEYHLSFYKKGEPFYEDPKREETATEP